MNRSDELAQTGRSSIWSRLFDATMWLGVLGLLTLALLRIFYHDGRHPLIWFNAFTQYLYLPAYATLAIAAYQRRWPLAAVSAAIISCHLWWIAPDFCRDTRFEAITAHVARDSTSLKSVRIFFANVQVQNPELDAFVREIDRADPDIIIFAEYSLPWRQALRDLPLSMRYPYGNGMSVWTLNDIAMFSRLPLLNEKDQAVAERIVRSADIDLGDRTLHLIGLHAPRPMNFHENDYDAYWQRAFQLIASAPHPLVVIGDCNATQYSVVYEELKAGGLRSAHEDRGRGYATTWPNGTVPLPPIRIDQAFLSPDVICSSISEGEGPGSDHKPLILDLQIGETR
jgi:endonuclease/exonuclease/phosphatase (EEP) superfamily protein YafD